MNERPYGQYNVIHNRLRVAVGDTARTVKEWVAEQSNPHEYEIFKYVSGDPNQRESWESLDDVEDRLDRSSVWGQHG